MKKFQKNSLLPPLVLILSEVLWWLRRQLYAVAVDAKGLLVAGHPLEISLWALALAGAGLIVLWARKQEGSAVYEDNFSASVWAGAAQILMGGTVLLMVRSGDFLPVGRLAGVWMVLGYLSAPALVWGGICRIRGKKPFFLIHAAACLFLLLYVVARYQNWSANPQLLDYVFELLAAVALVLFCYYHAAFEADMGNRRMLLATGLLALLLCGAALPGTQVPGLYLCGTLWSMTDLCRLDPPPKQEEVERHDPS